MPNRRAHTVDGDTAIVGGEVTHSSLPRYLGKQMLLFVEDSSTNAPRLSPSEKSEGRGSGRQQRRHNPFGRVAIAERIDGVGHARVLGRVL